MKPFHLTLLMAVATVPSVAAATPSYIVTDLGTLGGALVQSGGTAISNSGVVVGSSYSAGSLIEHAFVYTSARTGMKDLGTLGGSYSAVYGINDANEMVGQSNLAGNRTAHAFSTSGAGLTDLGTLGGNASAALGINRGGQIAGTSTVAGNEFVFHAFLYSNRNSDKGMKDLGTLGGLTSAGQGINNAGQVVGYSDVGDSSAYHAFIADGTGMKDLGTLGGSSSNAWGINNAGQVTGYSYTDGDLGLHAFVSGPAGLIDLSTLDGGDGESIGTAINDAGVVVGMSSVPGGGLEHAFVTIGTEMFDLNGMIASYSGWMLEQAYGINNSGQITGQGIIGGQTHAFLLTPGTPAGPPDLPPAIAVSEPASLAVLGLGLLGLGFVRRPQPRSC